MDYPAPMSTAMIDRPRCRVCNSFMRSSIEPRVPGSAVRCTNPACDWSDPIRPAEGIEDSLAGTVRAFDNAGLTR